jgi:diguanylate cyclase (GGDEF)-like protein
MLDMATLHLCSIAITTASAVILAIVWWRERAAHLGYAAAASLSYGVALVGLGFVPGSMVPPGVFTGLVGLNSALLVMAARAFDGERPLDGFAAAMPLACLFAHLIPWSLPDGFFGLPHRTAAHVGYALALCATAVVGGVLLLRHAYRSQAPRGCRIIAAGLLGYLPAFVITVALELGYADLHQVLATVAMLSDQALLGVIAIGVLSLSGERDAARLREAALRDPLTGAWNRAGLAALARGGAIGAVALIDVDHFKQVNDRHGHAAGDAVLRDLAHAITRLLPAPAALVRLGGDEFALLARDTAQAHALCDAVLAATPRLAAGMGWSLSIGVAARVAGEADLTRTLARADTMLYRAKQAGRGRLAA